jgi:integrase
MLPTSSIKLWRGARDAKVNHRAAITEPGEPGALLRAIKGYHGQVTTKLALELSALLFVRRDELRMARWKEIDFEKAVGSATPRAVGPPGHRNPARAAWHDRAKRVRLPGRGLVWQMHG